MKRFRTGCILGAVGCALVLIACHASPGAQPTPAGWTTHSDPLGFTVALPPGWKAGADARSGRVTLTGTKQERVVVWPVFIPASLNSQGAAQILARLAPTAEQQLTWSPPIVMGPGAVRALGHSPDRSGVAGLTWINSAKGAAAYLYAVSAPGPAYATAQDSFAQMLASFRLVGAPSSAKPAAAVTYVRWHDPKENAFSFEVPQGWQVTGGLFRFAAVDTRAAWEALSPDGKIRISGGDAGIPTFTQPNQILDMTGFHEGSWYSAGYGVNMLVRRYVPGTAFAREYVMHKIGGACGDLQVVQERDRADAVEALNAINAQFRQVGMNIHNTAGEVAFHCQRNGAPMQGYYFASTEVSAPQYQGPSLWSVKHLYGFLAAEGMVEQAQAVGDHLLKSIEINPQWAAMQQGITANTSRIVAKTNAEISSIISQTYWNRQASMDELSRRRSNATLGVEDVVDPATGEQLKVESGANYYWADNRGIIVGTQTDTKPSLDFRALVRLP